MSWVWRVFSGPLPRLNSKNSIPLIIFNLIGPSVSFPSPKAPYSVLLSFTYLGGLGHLASHIRRTGDLEALDQEAWRTPGGRLDPSPLLYERTRRPRPVHLSRRGGQDHSCRLVLWTCQGMSGYVRVCEKSWVWNVWRSLVVWS